MNNTIKNINIDEMLPVAGYDAEPTTHVQRIMAGRVVFAAKAENAIDERRATPERDAGFQRLMSVATGDLQPSLTRLGVPDVEVLAEQLALSVVVKSPKQLRTMGYLLHAGEDGIPIVELKHLVGAGNPGQPVSRLNKKFGCRIIETPEFRVTNKTGKATDRGNYRLTLLGKLVAAVILARAGYVHDPASDRRHLNRAKEEASAFIASSSLDADDLLFLRDGTKSQWLRLLWLLRAAKGAWVSRYVADELLDSCNVRQVVRVAELKIGGAAIERDTRTMPNRDGKQCKYGLYRLADDWVEAADQLIRDTQAPTPKVTK